VEPFPDLGARTVPPAPGNVAFLLDQQAGRPGKDQGSATFRRDRADEADDEQRPRVIEVQFAGIVPVPVPRWQLPGTRLGKGDEGAAPVSRRRPGALAEQIVEDTAYPLGQDPGLNGIALGGFQVAGDLAPAGPVVGTYAVRVFQLPPPSPFHGEAVSVRERLPDHQVPVALEALDVRWGEGGELWSHELRLQIDGAPRQIVRFGRADASDPRGV
jgi:hypothetical protein